MSLLDSATGSRTVTITQVEQEPESRASSFSSSSSSSRHMVPYRAPAEYTGAVSTANRLSSIILSYPDWNDEISCGLRLEGEQFIFFVLEADSDLPREALITHLTGLKTILSPGRNRLQDPWKIGEFVGERFALDLYCKAYNKAAEGQIRAGSITPLVLERDGSPHDFAQEVISWMEDLEGSEEGLQELSSLSREVVPALTPSVNSLGVPMLRGLEEEEDPIHTWTSFDYVDSMDSRTARAVVLQFQQIMGRVNQKREQAILERQREQFTQILREENRILEGVVVQHEERLQSDIVQLKRDAEEQTDFLANSLGNIQAAHRETVQHQQATITAVNEEKRQLNVAYLEIHAQNQKHIARIGNLESRTNYLEGRVCQLQNELSNIDTGPSCTIS